MKSGGKGDKGKTGDRGKPVGGSKVDPATQQRETLEKQNFVPILCEGEWGIDTMYMTSVELSFSLGTGGITRKKIARAANCVIEFVGNIAHLGGNKRERLICRDYLTWLIHQRDGVVTTTHLQQSLYRASDFINKQKASRAVRERTRSTQQHAIPHGGMNDSEDEDIHDEDHLPSRGRGGAVAASGPEQNASPDDFDTEIALRSDDELHPDAGAVPRIALARNSSTAGPEVYAAFSSRSNSSTSGAHHHGGQLLDKVERDPHAQTVSAETYISFADKWLQDRDDIDALHMRDRALATLFEGPVLRRLEENTGGKLEVFGNC